MSLFAVSPADLAGQKAMLDEDTPVRVIVASTAMLLTGVFLPFWLPFTALVIFIGVEAAQSLLLRRLERNQFRCDGFCLLILVNAAIGMTCFIAPPTLLWFVAGDIPRVGSFIYIVGAFIAVTLVRPVILPLALANCLPPVVALGVILWDLASRSSPGETVFLTVAMLLLVGYFLVALLNNHRLHQELMQARDAALARAETQGRFLATMSHELRTPLNAILGLSQVLAERGASTGTGAEAEVIRDSARAMAVLVGDLLDSAAIEAGALRIALQPVDPLRSVAGQVRIWQPRFAERGLSLTFTATGARPGPVMIDPTRLSQCLSNLLSNAMRYTKVGGATVEMAQSGDVLDICVTDTGQGIPQAAVDRLFRAYEHIRHDVAQPGGGTGLGLAISRGIARAMGGDLRFERPAAEGARFRLTLRAPPATMAPQMPKRAPALNRTAATDPAPRLAGRRILIVDDIATNRLVLELMLKGLGAASEEAASGAAALALLGQRAFDAVLLDIRMPGMSGPETLVRLRAAGHGLPVIAVSADAGSDHQTKALAQGFSGYLVKPIESSRLEAVLAAVLLPVPTDLPRTALSA